MHLAVLGNPKSWYAADLERAATARGHRFVRLEYRQLAAFVPGDDRRPEYRNEDVELSDLDAVIVRTMPPGSLERVVFRMDVLARLEAAGVAVLNGPKAIECAVDKYLTTSRLQAAGLPVPETFVCEQADAALAACERLGGDVVVKPVFGAEGRGIVRVSDPDLAFCTFRTLERIGAVLYLQRYIDHDGSDVRALLFDGDLLGAIRRSNNADFRVNVSRSGSAKPHALTDRETQLARRAAAATDARFCGVDLLDDRDGTCHVIEVNGVPGWQAFARATGVDVAAEVIRRLEAHL
ncbi:MAG: RimK family alpha-L-glutamate ligase [Planctomycetaceae bacterium]